MTMLTNFTLDHQNATKQIGTAGLSQPIKACSLRWSTIKLHLTVNALWFVLSHDLLPVNENIKIYHILLNFAGNGNVLYSVTLWL